jgi:hypothetical protein
MRGRWAYYRVARAMMGAEERVQRWSNCLRRAEGQRKSFFPSLRANSFPCDPERAAFPCRARLAPNAVIA